MGRSSPWKEHSPRFSANVYCDQTAGWMKMPVGTEVDLGPGHIVLDGDPATLPPRKGHSSRPSFRPMSIVATVAYLSYCWAVVVRSFTITEYMLLKTLSVDVARRKILKSFNKHYRRNTLLTVVIFLL